MKNSEDPQPEPSKVFLWNVIAGVVASVVVIAFIQPLLTMLWNFLTSTSSTMLNSLVDTIYKNAALGDRNWVAVGVALVILNVPMLAGILGLILGLRRKPVHSDRPHALPPMSLLTMSMTRRVIAIFLAAVVGPFAILYLSISMFSDLQLNASFNQRMNVLAPHVSDQQLKQLRADWASMVSKADHKQIVIKMEDMASREHIKLPPLLLAD